MQHWVDESHFTMGRWVALYHGLTQDFLKILCVSTMLVTKSVIYYFLIKSVTGDLKQAWTACLVDTQNGGHKTDKHTQLKMFLFGIFPSSQSWNHLKKITDIIKR